MPLTPNEKQKVRAKMSGFTRAAELNERAWHYSQQRPFHYIDNPSSSSIVADCSGYVSIVYHDAMHDTGIFLSDPLGYRYTGWGNTWSEEAWLRHYGKAVPDGHKYFVGDIVRWGSGSHSHTAVCSVEGDRHTARFSSHGTEAGPVAVKIDYRSDLVGVWRHPALL